MIGGKPAGWKFESARHSLAAKGVVTNPRYMKTKFADWFREVPGDDEAMFRDRQLAQVREECAQEIEKAIADGRMSSKEAELFWRDEFGPERELFMTKGQSYEHFRNNCKKRCERKSGEIPSWNTVFGGEKK